MKLRDVDDADRRSVAAFCVVISLPFHYVFWLSLYQWVRDRPTVSPTTMAVVFAMGLAAFALGYVAYVLSTSDAGSHLPLLPNPVLYVAAVVLTANAVYQLMGLHLLACVESLAVGVGAFVLARRRSRAP